MDRFPIRETPVKVVMLNVSSVCPKLTEGMLRTALGKFKLIRATKPAHRQFGLAVRHPEEQSLKKIALRTLLPLS